jgi:anti-anti-sigma factor
VPGSLVGGYVGLSPEPVMHLFRFRRRQSVPEPARAHEVVRLRGDLDFRSATSTGRRLHRLISAGPEVLEVDLTEVDHLSPEGCAALFTALWAARKRGTRLIITHPNDQVRSAMRKIGLTRALARPLPDGDAGSL